MCYVLELLSVYMHDAPSCVAQASRESGTISIASLDERLHASTQQEDMPVDRAEESSSAAAAAEQSYGPPLPPPCSNSKTKQKKKKRLKDSRKAKHKDKKKKVWYILLNMYEYVFLAL